MIGDGDFQPIPSRAGWLRFDDRFTQWDPLAVEIGDLQVAFRWRSKVFPARPLDYTDV